MAVQRLSSSLNCFLLRGLPWATWSPRARTSGDSFLGGQVFVHIPGLKRERKSQDVRLRSFAFQSLSNPFLLPLKVSGQRDARVGFRPRSE